MKYACYSTKEGKSRISVVLSANENGSVFEESPAGLDLAHTTENRIRFTPGATLNLRTKYSDGRVHYDGVTGLKLPTCGASEVEIETDDLPGFLIPRIAKPLVQRRVRMPVRKNGKGYTIDDLKRAVVLVQEIAGALNLELAMFEGQLYIKV